MQISAVQHIQSSQVPSSDQDRRLKDACADFEALFIGQLLHEMRKSIPEDGVIPVSESEKLFREMLDGEYAKAMSRTSSLGFAELLYRQFSNNNGKEAPAAMKTKPTALHRENHL